MSAHAVLLESVLQRIVSTDSLAGLKIVSDGANSIIQLGITGDENRGEIVYTTGDAMTFATADAVRFTIDGAGNVTGSGNLEIAGNVSGSATSTGSFGAVSIGTPVASRALTVSGSVQLNNDERIYFQNSA